MTLGDGRLRANQLGADRKPLAGKLRKTPERVGDRLETKAAKALKSLGARKTPGSGNYVGRKGDLDVARPESLLFEAKEITGRRVTPIEITGWLRKIVREARGVRKTPALILGFTDMEGSCPKQWAAIPLEVFEKLVLAAGWEALENE